jgi:transcriptional regulator with XRE-family HTH domain
MAYCRNKRKPLTISAMRLKDWRQLAKLTLQEVADGIGVPHAATVEKHEKGHTLPRPGLQAKYEDFTKGAVTAQDWIDQFRDAQANPPSRTPRIAICSLCDRRADQPEVDSCTERDCPVRVKEVG